MAFRKKIRCSYQPPMNFGGFSERKSVPVERGDGLDSVEIKDVSMSDVAKTSLPMISLEAVLQSGKPIKGDVSFAPTDPTFALGVESTLSDVLESVEPSNNQ